LYLVLIVKFDQKPNFWPWLTWVKPHTSPLGPKQGENVVLKSRELYYTDFMYKYFQLTLVVVLIMKFDQKVNHSSPIGLKSAI